MCARRRPFHIRVPFLLFINLAPEASHPAHKELTSSILRLIVAELGAFGLVLVPNSYA